MVVIQNRLWINIYICVMTLLTLQSFWHPDNRVCTSSTLIMVHHPIV